MTFTRSSIRRVAAFDTALVIENATAFDTVSAFAPVFADHVIKTKFIVMMTTMQEIIQELRIAQSQQFFVSKNKLKSVKLIKYNDKNKNAYSIFIKKCEKQFVNKGIHIDHEKINNVVTYLKRTADNV